MTPPYCAVCEQDQRQVPTMILARWHDQDICLDCLEERPGKDEAEAEARGERQPMTQQDYRDYGGGVCPSCKDERIEVGRMEFDYGIMHQRLTCNACEAVWSEHYRLAGYVRAGEGGDEDFNAFLNTAIVDED